MWSDVFGGFMVTETRFKDELMAWIEDNHIKSIKGVDFYEYFCYDYRTHYVLMCIDSLGEEVRLWIKEFLEDQGCRNADYPEPVLSFLHEIGHGETWDSFSAMELMLYSLMKDTSDTKEEAFEYWSVPDEYAANKWAANFINDHPQAVNDLWDIFYKYWNDLIGKEITLYDTGTL